jgi:hypothetical protein
VAEDTNIGGMLTPKPPAPGSCSGVSTTGLIIGAVVVAAGAGAWLFLRK